MPDKSFVRMAFFNIEKRGFVLYWLSVIILSLKTVIPQLSGIRNGGWSLLRLAGRVPAGGAFCLAGEAAAR
ncbi:MAG: hypothetical protein Q4F43_08695 [Eubacteriales bacterium]|nr:hypothetical protein [Eubacteriales bacterium]